MSIPVLTIDGPSGAGKGTVSRAVAKTLNWHYLDSGSIYRSLAVAVLDAHVALDDVGAIVSIADSLQLQFVCGDQLQVLLEGVDISHRLAAETTGNSASIIATLTEVRSILLQKQKDFRQLPGLVADGRDMGTVVFADASYKVFLTASAEERAQRRYKQLIEKGIDANLSRLTQEIEERDRRDRERKTAPLVAADNAFYLDSTDLSVNQVIEQVLNLVA